MDEELRKAIEILNEHEYVAVPITKGQMCLCSNCGEDVSKCRYNAIGYTCSNLICINQFIKEQIDYKEIISNIK